MVLQAIIDQGEGVLQHLVNLHRLIPGRAPLRKVEQRLDDIPGAQGLLLNPGQFRAGRIRPRPAPEQLGIKQNGCQRVI